MIAVNLSSSRGTLGLKHDPRFIHKRSSIDRLPEFTTMLPEFGRMNARDNVKIHTQRLFAEPTPYNGLRNPVTAPVLMIKSGISE